MEELQFQVIVDPTLGPAAEGVLAFGEFEVTNGAAYPDDGVQAFFEDLLLGKAFPLTLVTRGLHTIGKLVAITFFLQRDLALHPRAPSLVMSASLTDRLGISGLAHMDRDLARFFLLLSSYLPRGLSKREQQERLTKAVEWIHEYLVDERLPALPREAPPPKVLDVGTGGFVLAEAVQTTPTVWIELFRHGYLKGLLVTPEKKGLRKALAARKSDLVAFDLPKAASIFNEAEGAMGAPQEWMADGLWLAGPEKGTALPIPTLLEVFVRV